jgi:uncharacterized protein YjbJ (UPF0337 family)
MVMMNIAKSAVSSVRALLKKKGLKDAVDVTTKKAKAVSGKAKEAVAKAKPQVDKAVQATKTKAKTVTDKVKPAVEKAKAKVKPTVEKAKQTARAASVKARRKAGPKVRKNLRKAGEVAAAGTIGAGAVGLATAATPTLMGAGVGAGIGAGMTDDPFKGMKRGAIAGGALGLAATGALTASLLKTNQPKESGYTVKRLSDGRFSTTFQDANANAVFSSKQLSPKDIADVRKNVAVLDSIVLGDKITFLEKQEFMARLNYLADKYGVNNITGKNLSVLIPAVGKA